MIKIRYIILAVSAFLFVLTACEKEYEAPANTDFSDPVAAASGNNRIQRGDFTSFADLSQGVVARTWTIPPSAEFINTDGKEPSELDIAIIQFNEPGEFEIGLNSTFKDEAVVLDTFFEVTVLDFVKTEIDVVEINSSFFEETPTQITMYEGGAITFADSSKGSPNRREWILKGAEPNRFFGGSIDDDKDLQSVTAQYPEIGVYDVQLITWRQFPNGDPDTLTLTNYINITENVDPPTVSNIEQNSGGDIQVSFNLEMKVSGDLSSNFTLMVDGAPMDIASVALNSADRRVIDITPASAVKFSSTASLSYDGNGDLTRLNDVKAPAFSDEAITLYIPPNLLDMAGITFDFEDGSLNGWATDIEASNANAITNNSGATFELTTTEARSGNSSMMITINKDQNLNAEEKNNFRVFTNFGSNPIDFKAGETYRVAFWYKVVGDGLAECTWRYHGEGWPPALGGGWTSGAATDWKFREITFNAPNPEDIAGRMSMQFISKTENKTATFFIDDIVVYAVED